MCLESECMPAVFGAPNQMAGRRSGEAGATCRHWRSGMSVVSGSGTLSRPDPP